MYIMCMHIIIHNMYIPLHRWTPSLDSTNTYRLCVIYMPVIYIYIYNTQYTLYIIHNIHYIMHIYMHVYYVYAYNR